MGQAVRLLILAASMLVVIPSAFAHSIIRGRDGTYLDFRTNLVRDESGRTVGAATPGMYADLQFWSWGEVMQTTAVTVDATVRTDPWPGVELRVSDAGVCLHTYCVAAEVVGWGPTTMFVVWEECALPVSLATCTPRMTPVLAQGEGPGRLVYAAGFDPEASKGLILRGCLWVNNAPLPAENCWLDKPWMRPDDAPTVPEPFVGPVNLPPGPIAQG